jgi:hypothetical protein
LSSLQSTLHSLFGDEQLQLLPASAKVAIKAAAKVKNANATDNRFITHSPSK